MRSRGISMAQPVVSLWHSVFSVVDCRAETGASPPRADLRRPYRLMKPSTKYHELPPCSRCSLWLSDRSRKDAGTQRGECGMDPNHENLRPLTHFPSPARGEGGKNGCGVLGKGYSVFSVVRFGSKPGGMIDGASIDVL